MAIEGPLRELGIHDVFQLLDLSRKTGVLRVTSELRDDEGIVLLRRRHASCTRSDPQQAACRSSSRCCAGGQDHRGRPRSGARDAQPNGRADADSAICSSRSARSRSSELERQLRMQIESVVFELMSWREGFFSFEERARRATCRATRASASRPSRCSWKARGASTSGRASRTRCRTSPSCPCSRRCDDDATASHARSAAARVGGADR